jgi:hypothetical protein
LLSVSRRDESRKSRGVARIQIGFAEAHPARQFSAVAQPYHSVALCDGGALDLSRLQSK